MTIKGLMLLLMLPGASVLAQDCDCGEAVSEETGPWSGTVAFGYLATTGNSDTSSGNFSLKAVREGDPWVNNFYALASGASDSNQTTAERYNAGYRLDLKLDERAFLFGWLDFNKDLFSGINEKYSLALGYGRTLLATENHELSGEIGAGWRRERLDDGTENDNAIAKLAGNYGWTFGETSKFTQSLVVESGSDNTYAEAVSRVRAQLGHNTNPPAGKEKTDTFTALNLDYAF